MNHLPSASGPRSGRIPSTRQSSRTRRPRLGALAISAVLLCGGCQWTANRQNSLGARLYEQGQYSAALQHFRNVIQSDPANSDAFYNLAATNHRLGIQRGDTQQLVEAESLYNQCLDLDPNHVDCHRGLAVLLADTGRTDRAFALLKNWAAEVPNFAEPRIELARLYEDVRQPDTALKYLEDAVQKDPNNARAWVALGRLRQNAGDLQQALQNYQRSLALGGNTPEVQTQIASLSRAISAGNERRIASGIGGTPQMATAPSGMVRQRY